jgi:hypothetical protein
MSLLENFANISGLKINYSKTLAIKIGLNEDYKYKLNPGKEITWQTDCALHY